MVYNVHLYCSLKVIEIENSILTLILIFRMRVPDPETNFNDPSISGFPSEPEKNPESVRCNTRHKKMHAVG
jgi:hypothetical protein